MSIEQQPSLPPVLRPANPPRRELSELASRFARTVRGDVDGIALTGITLATADLRPGEAFVAIQASIGTVRTSPSPPPRRAPSPSSRTRPARRSQKRRDSRSSWSMTLALCSATSARGSTAPEQATRSRCCSRRPEPTARPASPTCWKAILDQIGVVTGLSSTAERHIAGEVIVSRLTTPEASEMHALLALMRERAVEAVAVEVSAQALSRHRVDGIRFDVAGFTNLSHDHLDDYATWTSTSRRSCRCSAPIVPSAASSASIPPRGRSSSTVPRSLSSRWALRPSPQTPRPRPPRTGSSSSTRSGQPAPRFTMTGPAGSLTTTVPVIGPHMAANAALAIVMLLEGGYAWDRIVEALTRDGGIRAYLPGRTQLVSGSTGPAVFVTSVTPPTRSRRRSPPSAE